MIESLFDEINFQGNERLKIEIAGMDENAEPIITKTFIMGNILSESGDAK